MSVRLCQLCHEPDWDDLARQLQEARRAERERVAAHVEELAGNYPEDVFPAHSDSRDAIGGTAMRHAYRNVARTIREDCGDGDG
jgi:hypothetical protein